MALIRALIAASSVAGSDQTTPRSGPAGKKKYVHGAFTELYSAFHPGTRSIESMKKGGVPEFFAGIVASDRYQRYRSKTWTAFAGHQARAAHLIRDFEDCAETYPRSGWPQQAQRALRGLIRARHAAREQGLPAVPAQIREPLELESRRAVTAGPPAAPRDPGPKTAMKHKPGREMPEFCRAREADMLRFASDTSAWPASNLSERGVRPQKTQQNISRRLTSDDITQNRPGTRGHTDTARKHGPGAPDVPEQPMPGRPRPSPSRRKAKQPAPPSHPVTRVNAYNPYPAGGHSYSFCSPR